MSGESKFVIFDPFCATLGGEVVAKNFKSRENADKWLARKTAEDDDGFAGCIVIPESELPAYTGIQS